jgi:hypothetical protein
VDGMTFDEVPIIETLSTMDEAALDRLPFGVVGLDSENVVELYNAHEITHTKNVIRACPEASWWAGTSFPTSRPA